MSKTKRRGPRIEVEWITVSYRTIVRWSAVVVGVAALAATVWLLRRAGQGGEHREVERLVTAVEQDVSTARAGRSGESVRELEPAQRQIAEARARLAAGALREARDGALAARELLRQLGTARTDRARVLQVEGQVQVKPVGSLDWVTGRVGMGLSAGDLIRTGPDSGAQIVHLDGSTATVAADTVFRIERSAKDRASGRTDVAVVVSSGQLTMATGELKAAGSKTEVQTTELRASIDPNTVVGVGVDEHAHRSELNVLQGRSEVTLSGGAASSAPLELGASERLDVSPGGVERRRLPGLVTLLSPPQYKLLLVRDLAGKPLELEWASARDARSYRVEVSQTPLFTRLAHRLETSSTFATAPPFGVGRYYWRVTALDADGIGGGPSPASIFQISDALPEGEPPRLKLTGEQALGEGLFIYEGETQTGVFLTIDDGEQVLAVQPGQGGRFRQVVQIAREGKVAVTITARNSEGLETRVVRNVEVRYQ